MPPGATAIPTSAVKITSDMTRGFSSSKKSRAVPMPPSGKASARSLLIAVSDMNSSVSVVLVSSRVAGQGAAGNGAPAGLSPAGAVVT